MAFYLFSLTVNIFYNNQLFITECPAGFELHGEYCFHFAMDTALKRVIYSEAEEYCAALGVTLAYPINTNLKDCQIYVSDAIPAMAYLTNS